MSKHTPEPWAIAGKNKVRLDCAYLIRPVDDKNYEYGATLAATNHEDSIRIVSCVNACAGMEDPEKEIAWLRKQRDKLLAALESLSEVAASCDGWESFPRYALDAANSAIMKVSK